MPEGLPSRPIQRPVEARKVTPERVAEAQKKVSENRAMLERNFEPEEVGKLIGACSIALRAAQLVHRPDNSPPIVEGRESDYSYKLFSDYVSQEFKISETKILGGIYSVTEELISEQRVLNDHNPQQ